MDNFQRSLQSHEIPKMVKVLSPRTGRLYYKPIDQISAAAFMSTQRSSSSSASSIQNPVVLASMAAGVLGVMIVIILILTIWIRRRCTISNYQQTNLTGIEAPTELDSCSFSSNDKNQHHDDTLLTINEGASRMMMSNEDLREKKLSTVS